MSKTFTVSDATAAELAVVFGGALAPGSTPTPPVVAPPGVRVIKLPWAHTPQPIPNVTIAPGEVIAFAITPPAVAPGVLGNFSISPTDQNDYFDRVICLSDAPGDFSGKLAPSSVKQGQEPNIYFSVGGPPTRTVMGHTYTDTSNPDLVAGRTYYVNVKQVDPTRSCRINYGLAPA